MSSSPSSYFSPACPEKSTGSKWPKSRLERTPSISAALPGVLGLALASLPSGLGPEEGLDGFGVFGPAGFVVGVLGDVVVVEYAAVTGVRFIRLVARVRRARWNVQRWGSAPEVVLVVPPPELGRGRTRGPCLPHDRSA